jgi:hypothetical protein
VANGEAGQKRQAEAQTLTPDQMEAAKKWLQLVAQARADKTLKLRLIDTPIVVLREHGINVRQGLDIRVVENTDKVVYLKLPAEAELTDRELDGIVGGLVDGDTLEAALGAVDAWNNMQEIIGTGVSVKIGPGDTVGVATGPGRPQY